MRRRRNKIKEDYTPVIDTELDLHGCTALEACTEVKALLMEAHEKDWNRVRIVVGKGTHSKHGAVLPDTVKNLLHELGYIYTYAKINEGGEGALEVVI